MQNRPIAPQHGEGEASTPLWLPGPASCCLALWEPSSPWNVLIQLERTNHNLKQSLRERGCKEKLPIIHEAWEVTPMSEHGSPLTLLLIQGLQHRLTATPGDGGEEATWSEKRGSYKGWIKTAVRIFCRPQSPQSLDVGPEPCHSPRLGLLWAMWRPRQESTFSPALGPLLLNLFF